MQNWRGGAAQRAKQRQRSERDEPLRNRQKWFEEQRGIEQGEAAQPQRTVGLSRDIAQMRQTRNRLERRRRMEQNIGDRSGKKLLFMVIESSY